jgi:hypothetical protein
MAPCVHQLFAGEISMPVKQFQFHADARQSILRGASILADAVRVTLGPKSKSVLIEKKFGRPLVCDDGVTIAKEVELRNPEENLGAQMIRKQPSGPEKPWATAPQLQHSWRMPF